MSLCFNSKLSKYTILFKKKKKEKKVIFTIPVGIACLSEWLLAWSSVLFGRWVWRYLVPALSHTARMASAVTRHVLLCGTYSGVWSDLRCFQRPHIHSTRVTLPRSRLHGWNDSKRRVVFFSFCRRGSSFHSLLWFAAIDEAASVYVPTSVRMRRAFIEGGSQKEK